MNAFTKIALIILTIIFTAFTALTAQAEIEAPQAPAPLSWEEQFEWIADQARGEAWGSHGKWVRRAHSVQALVAVPKPGRSPEFAWQFAAPNVGLLTVSYLYNPVLEVNPTWELAQKRANTLINGEATAKTLANWCEFFAPQESIITCIGFRIRYETTK